MVEKTLLYEYTDDDLKNLTDIEKTTYKKADELNDKLMDLKILIDEIDDDWRQFIEFLEFQKISKVCEFRGGECIDFDRELINAVVNTLKKTLNDTNKSINYNSKKITLNRVIDG